MEVTLYKKDQTISNDTRSNITAVFALNTKNVSSTSDHTFNDSDD